MERVCERCAGEDEELEAVHRLPAPADQDHAPELWCASCRSLYPHELPEEEDEA